MYLREVKKGFSNYLCLNWRGEFEQQVEALPEFDLINGAGYVKVAQHDVKRKAVLLGVWVSLCE